MSEQVYIQIRRFIHVASQNVTVKDIASVFCENKHISDKIKSLCIYKFSGEKKKRVVLSALYIIKHIQEYESNIDIVPIGSTDTIIKYEPHPKNSKFFDICKVAIICLTTFFGAGFSIVAFNSDIDLNRVFSTLHDKFNITDTSNFAIMKIAYSVGIALGIMIFYNHFGNRKFTTDPTPLEIEMRLYENDINTSIIDGDNREVDC